MRGLATFAKYGLLMAALTSVVLSFVLYGNTISGDFVYDDAIFVNRAEFRQAGQLLKNWIESQVPSNLAAGHFRPLGAFTFNLNFLVFGESPASFHIVNIILNGVVVFLVFLLVRRLFDSTILAAFSALLYAFFPIHTEAVASIKSRDEILSALFGLWSWLTFISAKEKENLNYKKIFTSALLFLLAVLSKELIIALPALLILAFWFRKNPPVLDIAKILAIFAGVGVFYMTWRYGVLGEYAFGREIHTFIVGPLAYIDVWTRIPTAFKIAFLYVAKTFAPWNLSATYHYNHLTLVQNIFQSWQALAGLAALASLLVLAIDKKLRNSPAGLGALAFLVPYSVISKFIFKGGDIFAERWMYFPSAGLSIIGGYLIYRIFLKIKWLGIAVLAAILALYAFIVIPRNSVWLSEENLFRSMLKTAPESAYGHISTAYWYFTRGRLEEAKKEAETAFKIYSKDPVILNTIGLIAEKEKKYAYAEKFFLSAIEAAPKTSTWYQNLAKLYFEVGEYKRAKAVLEDLTTDWPRPRLDDFIDYAIVLSKLGEYDKSMEVINGRLAGEHNRGRVRMALAINYFKTGNLGEARKYFDWNPSLSEDEQIAFLKSF